MGETDVETMANVTIAKYDFEDEAFNDVSPEAKDFISKCKILLVMHICVSLLKTVYFGFNKGFNEFITCLMLFFAIQRLDYCCMFMYMFTNL